MLYIPFMLNIGP